MSHPRAPPNHWRTLCQRQNYSRSSIVKGRHTGQGVPPSFVFSHLGEKGFDYHDTRRILQFQSLQPIRQLRSP